MAIGALDRKRFEVDDEEVEVAILRSDDWDRRVQLSSRGTSVEAGVDDRIAHALGDGLPEWAVIALRRLGVEDVVGAGVDVAPGRGRV